MAVAMRKLRDVGVNVTESTQIVELGDPVVEEVFVTKSPKLTNKFVIKIHFNA